MTTGTDAALPTILARASYNYWIAQSGAGTGPFTVRLTDAEGNQVTVHNVALDPSAVQSTGVYMYGAGSDPASPAAGPVRHLLTTRTGGRIQRRVSHAMANFLLLLETFFRSIICARASCCYPGGRLALWFETRKDRWCCGPQRH
jgi:hypothetical protein